MNKEMIIVLDCGGQYSRLVASKVRSCNVYCEVYSYRSGIDKISKLNPKGIILVCMRSTDADMSKDVNATVDDKYKDISDFGIPVLVGEELHSQNGDEVIKEFVEITCGCAGDWNMKTFVEESIQSIKEIVGDGKVLCALSGGVDSSVAAVMLSKAIGNQLTCVFVDHGLLRKNEGDQVEEVFGSKGCYDLNFIRINAQDRFYSKLAGVTEPEEKRKIIGEEFIRVFEEEANKIGKVDFLVQGTIYPDIIESGVGEGATVIKSHHNVGGLPDYVDFKEIIEPLKDLFKDEVRLAGLELGIPEHLVFRQPFPGPGLGVRIVGEVTAEKVKIVQEADAICREEMEKVGMNKIAGQYFAALTNMRSVGVTGDKRTYDYAVALRAVNTTDFMTAKASEVPWEVLQKITDRIIGEVDQVNRVLYDLTGKPPGTIELE